MIGVVTLPNMAGTVWLSGALANMTKLNDWPQGMMGDTWQLTVLKADNSAKDITGATFTGCLYEIDAARRVTLTTGSYAIVTAASGIFSYAPAAVDTAEPGNYIWETIFTISSRTFNVRAFITVVPKLAA